MGRPRTDIPSRVLHAARARFLADGVDGASLRTIAKDAQTSIGMIFYYYPTKDALFLAVVEERYARLLEDLTTTLSAAMPLRDRLRAAFARLGHASTEELDVVRLVVREALVSSPRFVTLVARFRRGHISLVLQALSDGQASGAIDESVPLPLALIATFGIGGLPQLARRIAGDAVPFAALPSVDLLAEAAVDVLFRGIGPRGVREKATGFERARRREQARGKRHGSRGAAKAMVKPAKPAKPPEPTKPAKPAKPAKSPEPTKPTKLPKRAYDAASKRRKI